MSKLLYAHSAVESQAEGSYHDGVDESHNVYGPDGAEAGQH